MKINVFEEIVIKEILVSQKRLSAHQGFGVN